LADGSSCAACVSGKYAHEQGSTICSDCEANSDSGPESSICLCNAGFSGNQSSCLECPGGTFKNAPGSSICAACAVGTYSSSATACTQCEAGKYSPTHGMSDCVQCEPSKHQASAGASSCQSCHVLDATSQPGSTDPSDCFCSAGLFDDGVSCAPCGFGTFFDQSAVSETVLCTSTTTEAPACEKILLELALQHKINLAITIEVAMTDFSSSSEKITGVFLGGQQIGSEYLVDGGADDNCARMDKILDAVEVPQGSVTAAGELVVRIETSSSVNSYPCDGYYLYARVTVLGQIEQCTPCPPGTYSITADGVNLCQDCAAGTYSETNSVSECSDCIMGKYSSSAGGDNVDSCLWCEAGEYTEEGGSSACTSCPSGTLSLGGTGCVEDCPTGYYQDDTQACWRCEAGKFSAFNGSSTCSVCEAGTYSSMAGSTGCVSCQANATSPSASASASACVCIEGYAGNHLIGCSKCQAGKYSDLASESCIECPEGSFAATASSVCTLCPEGKYLPVTGSTSEAACVACSAQNSISPAGSIAETDCACQTGYYGNMALGCEECGANMYAPDGATLESDCICLPGYTGDLCEACAAGKFTNPSSPLSGSVSCSGQCSYECTAVAEATSGVITDGYGTYGADLDCKWTIQANG
jgi:hypothetical protein